MNDSDPHTVIARAQGNWREVTDQNAALTGKTIAHVVGGEVWEKYLVFTDGTAAWVSEFHASVDFMVWP